MNWFTFLPLVVTLALGTAAGRVVLPLHPAWEARLLGTVAASTTTAVAGTLLFVAINYGASLRPQWADRLPEWTLIGDDTPIPATLGIPATVLTAVGLAITVRLAAGWAEEIRQARRAAERLPDTDVPIALAIPGRRGGVLVSRGLLTELTSPELRVVFEHEGSHLRHRHHRYLAAGALAAGLLPPLRRLDERLRLAVERWADEDAAEAVGDRVLVARTVARVALARSQGWGAVPGFAESGVVQRVEALLAAPPAKSTFTGPVLLAGMGLPSTVLALTALQLDHALALALLS
ncbi:Peptidase family M48 [Thermomonospora echinospora]|uniref:Peptidase family M48 n=1 Tax=Thermomonospora echinospora TaxID=1992 RepID=A0A1H6C9F1_9ACTN|nr:M56 family metallopeptidase [Thermomonospora echinospora]SEG69532.1 Peptidase family M48 [Thermomonospora echinospora]